MTSVGIIALFIALSSAGAFLRWSAGLWLGAPWGTLAINILGSFLMGYCYYNLKDVDDVLWKVPLLVGFLGALTTYSSFSLECLQFLQTENYRGLGLYMVTMNIFCIVGCWGGYSLGSLMPFPLNTQ